MAIKIFVTATNTNIGKTYTTLSLMEEVAKQGLRPGAFKPIETGVMDNRPADGTQLLTTMHRLNPSAKEVTIDDIVPFQFELPAAPYVAKGEQAIPFEPIIEKLKRVEEVCDILFIEGAGGLLVPIDERHFMIDLPNIFDAHTLLIAPSRLGSINDTLLSMEALQHREIDFTLAVNLYEDRESFSSITESYYINAGVSYYLLPRDINHLMSKLSS